MTRVSSIYVTVKTPAALIVTVRRLPAARLNCVDVREANASTCLFAVAAADTQSTAALILLIVVLADQKKLPTLKLYCFAETNEDHCTEVSALPDEEYDAATDVISFVTEAKTERVNVAKFDADVYSEILKWVAAAKLIVALPIFFFALL